jgi:RimJ/RimL family protein N-acetyltransferase
MTKQYLFTSSRLGMRAWSLSDLDSMAAINQNKEVMEFFPYMPDRIQSMEFIERMQKMFAEKKYCYFATDTLVDGKFIGFIGIAYQDYNVPFAPFTDIGWRLHKSAWGNGYATEGAIASLDYAFNSIGLPEIYSLASEQNVKSEKVMQKIGMIKQDNFEHPKLIDYPDLKKCCLYRIQRKDYISDSKK